MPIRRKYDAEGRMDHLTFPNLCKELLDTVIELHFGPRRLAMREICYVLHCNLFSVYSALHPGHEERIAEIKGESKTSKDHGGITVEQRISQNPEITDCELIHKYGYSLNRIRKVRRKLFKENQPREGAFSSRR